MKYKRLKSLALCAGVVPVLASAQATIEVETQPTHKFDDALHIDLHITPSDDTANQAADLWVYLQDGAGNKAYVTPVGTCLEGSADCTIAPFSPNETIVEGTIDIDDVLSPGGAGIPLGAELQGDYSIHAVYTNVGENPDSGTLLSNLASSHTIVDNGTAVQPNLVIFLADDLGYSDISPFGGEVATPTLDSMTASGTLLTNFHSHASCSPTRSITLSGVDNHRNGLGTMDGRLLPARLGGTINQYDRTEKVPADIEAIDTALDSEGKPNNPKFGQGKNIGKDGYEGHLNQKVVTIATVLRNAGYHTYMIGKWHLGEEIGYRPYYRGFEKTFALLEGAGSNYDHIGFSPNFPYTHYTQQGEITDLPTAEQVAATRAAADALVGYSDQHAVSDQFYSTRDYTDFMINNIEADRQADGERKPFFTYFAYQAPHAPLQAPTDLVEKYLPVYEQGWDVLRQQRFDKMAELGIIPAGLPAIEGKTEATGLPLRWSFVKAWDELNSNEQAFNAKKMAIYAAMTEYMDYNMKRFMDYLRNVGEYDNTIFLFFGDNGADDQDRDMQSRPPLNYLNWYPTVGITNCYPHNLKAPGTVITAEDVESYKDTPAGQSAVGTTIGNIKDEACFAGMGAPKSMLTLPLGWAQVSATPHFAAKATMAEGGLRASAIIMGPGIQQGQISDAFMTALDVFPTFLDYARVKHPVKKNVKRGSLAPYRDVKADANGELKLNLNPSFEYIPVKNDAGRYTNAGFVREIYPLDGRSFRAVLNGAETKSPYGAKQGIGFELYGSINRALYMGEWKILKLDDDRWGDEWDNGEEQEWALFNLKQDPRELVNVAAENPEIFNEMKKKYDDYVRVTTDPNDTGDVNYIPAHANQQNTRSRD
ncbi:sulfatase-like hydrolase/transferase [Candidatus Albibeggiatoa sp. nov. NOAA]|uniref:sulfatase-like hydrolase/transferase n=1 Tax=Candidatus Albibeggiatoa sp. nov. NOAA TaxID=3162724 RepID=UPI0032F8D4C5|nr:sulfatase-like hydrolase/transferase [Thiotrichaceae bacterium]